MLALAGIAYSAPQPPGSVFKIITLTAGLESGDAKPSNEYPVETAATLEGVRLENANGESCGGSLKTAFAHSCNSVFAPMGAELGAQRLVETAEQYRLQQGARAGGRGPLDDPRRVPRSATTSRSARRRSARARCSPRRSLFAGVAGAIAEKGMGVAPTLRKGAAGEADARWRRRAWRGRSGGTCARS